MNSKSYCGPQARKNGAAVIFGIILLVSATQLSFAGDAPAWMHALASAPLPAHTDETNAVLLYDEQIVTVVSVDKIKTHVRKAYKILRPDGRNYGNVSVPFNRRQKINGLHGWCIPAQGKDYEVKDKDAVEVALPNIEGSELISDVRSKFLSIPAADPGSIVGYEYELEEQPFALQDDWYFQDSIPVRESHYRLALPPGWELKTTWFNAPESPPAQSGNLWEWTVTNVRAAVPEFDMPPWRAVAGHMDVSFSPAGGAPGKSFGSWQQMGLWYAGLTSGRSDPSPAIQQKVAALTAGKSTMLAKIQAIAAFVQADVRYVAIELGIGGWQPHPAADVFAWRYGDCKDKATLVASMLREIGVDSYYVVINTNRGAVSPTSPPHAGAFDHAIIAIKLPDNVKDDSLHAVLPHPQLSRLLFFDPTNEFTPFGQIGGYLQGNYGLVVAGDGSELLELPKQSTDTNGIHRTAKLKLAYDGTLEGDFEEVRLGDRAVQQRAALRSVTTDADRVKPVEQLLSHAFSKFRITHASVLNLSSITEPFGYRYSVVAPEYAKATGDLLLVRPRIVGSKSSTLLDTKEPRRFPVVFDGLVEDTDSFEISIPSLFTVDDLPSPVDAEYSFASYHSKTDFTAGVLRYTRTFEIKEFTVPLDKIEDLRKFYRLVANDERSTAVLRRIAK
ncbi:MAG: DUF3857 domain-containing transglutaminase family protein [Terriglobales bacterium]